MEAIFQGNPLSFIAPSGNLYIIREQNGEDDDVLSNPTTVMNLMNVSHFISGIVLETTLKSSGGLTTEEALNLPSNDRWAILLKSRIHSIGDTLSFTHDWGREKGGIVEYEQDLNELLFNHYSEIPSDEELERKKEAIPYYPMFNVTKDLPILTSSGKELLYDIASGASDSYMLGLDIKDRTKNKELVARNLRLKVADKYEKVENFRMFTTRDMAEIRKEISTNDPVFTGAITIENPNRPGMTSIINILGVDNFFFQDVI